MPRLRFTIGRLMGIPLILGGALGLLESMGTPRSVALPSAVCMSAGPVLLLLVTRDRRELMAAYAAITAGGTFYSVIPHKITFRFVDSTNNRFISIFILFFASGYSVMIFRRLNRRPSGLTDPHELPPTAGPL